MANVTYIGESRNNYLATARYLDKKHSLNNALFAYVRGIENRPDSIYSSAFEETVKMIYPIEDIPTEENVSIVTWMCCTSKNTFLTTANKEPNVDDIILSFEVNTNQPKVKPTNLETVERLFDGLISVESNYLKVYFELSKAILKSLEKEGFTYESHSYTPCQDFILILGKGTVKVKITLWIEDAMRLAIF